LELSAAKLPALMLSAEIYLVPEVPKLGSGKTDFAAAKKLALELGDSD